MKAPARAKFRQTVQGNEYRFVAANKTAERWLNDMGKPNGLRPSELCAWVRGVDQVIWKA